MRLIVGLVIAICAILGISANETDCVVRIKNGLIKGDCEHLLYDAYTHIPYAQPPLGRLRFEPPQAVLNWEGVRDATGGPVESVQFYQGFTTLKGLEDSLYINVYVPRKIKPNSKPMVMIYVYPGAFQFGTPTNDPEFVMSQGDAILVTFAYRTGPLGFLSTFNQELPGNMGLKDQRMAIQWVEQNIAAFGGDTKRILLFGCSAGGASTEYHLLTGQNNIKAFASLSGSTLNPWAFTKYPLKPAKEFGELLNCPLDASFKRCLQKKSLEDIWQADITMHKFYGFNPALFRPTLEPLETPNAFLTQEPLEMLKSGQGKPNVKYLVGVVEGEGGYLAANLLQFNKNGIEAVEELNDRWQQLCPVIFFCQHQTQQQQIEICQNLQKKYMCGQEFNLKSYKLLERMFGDEYFLNGIDRNTALHSAAGRKVYRYMANIEDKFNWGNVFAMGRKDLNFGSVHGSDILSIMPAHSYYTPPPSTVTQTQTKAAFVNLLKSLVEDGPPTFKDIELKPLSEAAEKEQCLFFSYDEYYTTKCGFGEVQCHDVKSVHVEL